TYTDLWRNIDMLNPLRSGFYVIELISHKVLRYAVPIMLLALFVSNALLAELSIFFYVIFAAQVLFYLMALVGWVLEKLGVRLRFLVIPLYFVLANLATVIAFFKFISGERVSTWEPIRDVR
ncbi:MAG: hypothetical protein KA956_01525, partial [Pyrinomonadaceae bacterium]|nr:hypothetical protein [Pyrinomonadaceae bacterium]